MKSKVTNNINVSGGSIVSWSVTYKVEYRIKGTTSWTLAGEVTVTNNARSNFRRIFRQAGLTPAKYEIRITRMTPDANSKQTGDLNLTSVDEIRNENIAYVNTALLAVHMLANNQISGAIPNISCIVSGKKVAVYE